MRKQVRETKAGQSISAWVILNPDNEEVANVQAHHSNAGMVTVDVWNYNKSKTQTDGPQQSKAGGYGYDKITAAMSGLVIDGIELKNHCTYGQKGKKDVRGANWNKEKDDYGSWYVLPGLERLEALDYKVLRAI